MLEKSQYDLRNDADVQESTEMDSLSSKNKESLNIINELNKKVDGHQKSLSEKDEAIQQLTVQVDKLNESTEEYQQGLSEKEEIILQLKAQVVGQNEAAEEYKKRLSEKEETVSEKDEIIQKLTSQVDKSSHTLFDYYQKSLSVKDDTISQLTTLVDGQKEAAEEYKKRLSEKEEAVSGRDKIINQLSSRIDNLYMFTKENQMSLSENEEAIYQRTARLDSQNVITLEKHKDEEKETIPQVILETDSSDEMAQVKSLYNDGKYDDAYRIADDLSKKNPRLGLAYYILGAIEMLREYYDKGEELLNKAIQLKLSNEDTAWAFHNLGISSLRKKNYKKAREFLEKSVKLNPNMEKSRKTLELLNNLQEKERDDKEEVEAVDGKMEARILTT